MWISSVCRRRRHASGSVSRRSGPWTCHWRRSTASSAACNPRPVPASHDKSPQVPPIALVPSPPVQYFYRILFSRLDYRSFETTDHIDSHYHIYTHREFYYYLHPKMKYFREICSVGQLTLLRLNRIQ